MANLLNVLVSLYSPRYLCSLFLLSMLCGVPCGGESSGCHLNSSRSGVPTTQGFSTNRFRRTTVSVYTTEQTISENVQGLKNVLITDFHLKEPLKKGFHLVLWGTAPTLARIWFILNLRLPIKDPEQYSEWALLHMAGVAVHFRPYMDVREVVFNTINNENPQLWGREERPNARPFPFIPGQRFKLEILWEQKQTVWLVDGEYLCTYLHRDPSPVGVTRVQVVNIEDPILYLAPTRS